MNGKIMDREFVGYLNELDVHDATVEGVVEEDGRLLVQVKTLEGKRLTFEFNDVRSVRMNHPEGMVLYSLSEMKESPPYRHFVFTNWDEEDDSYLEVTAREVTSSMQQ